MRFVYIDIDTLRFDHLGCYGYHRMTSPSIDALAAESVRFENVYASDVPCLPSRTALITGMFGIRNGVGMASQPSLRGNRRSPDWRRRSPRGRRMPSASMAAQMSW